MVGPTVHLSCWFQSGSGWLCEGLSSACLPVCPSVRLSVYRFFACVAASLALRLCVYVRLSVCPCVRLSACVCVCARVCVCVTLPSTWEQRVTPPISFSTINARGRRRCGGAPPNEALLIFPPHLRKRTCLYPPWAPVWAAGGYFHYHVHVHLISCCAIPGV